LPKPDRDAMIHSMATSNSTTAAVSASGLTNVEGALAMIVVTVAAAVAALEAFVRRDLQSG
jgi:hypothetical protein